MSEWGELLDRRSASACRDRSTAGCVRVACPGPQEPESVWHKASPCASSSWRRAMGAPTIRCSLTRRLYRQLRRRRRAARWSGSSCTRRSTQSGLSANLTVPCRPLPFLYESTGEGTMFTDGFDPVPRSRGLIAFHRPQSLARQLRLWVDDPDAGSLRARLQNLTPLKAVSEAKIHDGLRTIQLRAIKWAKGHNTSA